MVTIPEDEYFTGSSAGTSHRLNSDTAPNKGTASILTISAVPSPGNTYLVIGYSL